MKYESDRTDVNPDRPWEMLPRPKDYGHIMNDPRFRRFKRDSRSSRRHRPAGAPIYKRGTKPAEQKKGKK